MLQYNLKYLLYLNWGGGGREAYICRVPCSDSGHFTVLIKYQNDFPCTVLNEEAVELQVLIGVHLLLAIFLSIALF